jgi:hypothetical protein
MRSPHERPATAICPRTGSRVFIRDEMFYLIEPIEVVCPACDRWHVWDPATHTLREPDQATADCGGGKAR